MIVAILLCSLPLVLPVICPALASILLSSATVAPSLGSVESFGTFDADPIAREVAFLRAFLRSASEAAPVGPSVPRDSRGRFVAGPRTLPPRDSRGRFMSTRAPSMPLARPSVL